MEAHEKAFTFMAGPIRIEIPFFQRGYVWNEENWKDLVEDLGQFTRNYTQTTKRGLLTTNKG